MRSALEEMKKFFEMQKGTDLEVLARLVEEGTCSQHTYP